MAGWHIAYEAKTFGYAPLLPHGACLCSPVSASCSNIKCHSGSFTACGAGNLTSARRSVSHIFGMEEA